MSADVMMWSGDACTVSFVDEWSWLGSPVSGMTIIVWCAVATAFVIVASVDVGGEWA